MPQFINLTNPLQVYFKFFQQQWIISQRQRSSRMFSEPQQQGVQNSAKVELQHLALGCSCVYIYQVKSTPFWFCTFKQQIVLSCQSLCNKCSYEMYGNLLENQNMKKVRQFWTNIDVSFTNIQCFGVEKLMSGVLKIFKWFRAVTQRVKLVNFPHVFYYIMQILLLF